MNDQLAHDRRLCDHLNYAAEGAEADGALLWAALMRTAAVRIMESPAGEDEAAPPIQASAARSGAKGASVPTVTTSAASTDGDGPKAQKRGRPRKNGDAAAPTATPQQGSLSVGATVPVIGSEPSPSMGSDAGVPASVADVPVQAAP